MKVGNEFGDSITTKMAIKQLCYIPITYHAKASTVVLIRRSKETNKMTWHKEGKYDCEDSYIMVNPVNAEALQSLDCFDLEFVRDLRSVYLSLSMGGFKPFSSSSSSYSC
jgi:hypothetical protein